jgi:hypothetical protein
MGGNSTNYCTEIFANSSFTPLISRPLAGNWTLYIRDDHPDRGAHRKLNKWEIELDDSLTPVPTPPPSSSTSSSSTSASTTSVSSTATASSTSSTSSSDCPPPAPVPGAECISGQWFYNYSLVITDLVTVATPLTIGTNFTLDHGGQLVVIIGSSGNGSLVVEGCAAVYGTVLLNFTRAPEDGEIIEFLHAMCVDERSTTSVEITGHISECEEARAEQLDVGEVVVRVTSHCESSSEKRMVLTIVGAVLGGLLLLLVLLVVVIFSLRRYRESHFWSSLIWSPERGRQVVGNNYFMLDEHS